jgi:hypothetical protein
MYIFLFYWQNTLESDLYGGFGMKERKVKGSKSGGSIDAASEISPDSKSAKSSSSSGDASRSSSGKSKA